VHHDFWTMKGGGRRLRKRRRKEKVDMGAGPTQCVLVRSGAEPSRKNRSKSELSRIQNLMKRAPNVPTLKNSPGSREGQPDAGTTNNWGEILTGRRNSKGVCKASWITISNRRVNGSEKQT